MNIKINIFKSLEQRVAICSFCGEEKDCIKGSVPVIAKVKLWGGVFKLIAELDIDKHYKPSIFGEDYYKVPESDEKYAYVQNRETPLETTEEKEDAYICKDCIKQLAKIA